MTDTLAAYSPGPPGKDADGMEVPTTISQGSTFGKVSGRSRQGDTNTRYADVAGVSRPVVEGGVHIPLSAPVPSIGWTYVVTTVGPNSDPALQGRRYLVVDVPAKSHATARRLDVVEVP